MQPESVKAKEFASRLYTHKNFIAQAIPTGAWTTVVWAPPPFDGLNEFTIAAPLYYFQPRRAGYYLLHAQAFFDLPIAAATEFRIAFCDTALVIFANRTNESPGNRQFSIALTRIENLTPNSTVMVRVFTNDPAGSTLLGGPTQTYFMAHRLS